MKNLKYHKLPLVLLVVLFWAVGGLSTSHAQTVTYLWADSLGLSSTGRDSLFATPWEEVSIFVSGGSAYVKYGAPDTTSWSSRNFILLIEGQVITFGPGTKLKRLKYKMASGTGTIYFIGTKKRAQF
jgi:hypothetical protein